MRFEQLLFGFAALALAAPRVEVVRIWGQASHNAFTDLLRFKGRWYCAFREGQAHVSPDGAVRILTSADGDRWDPAALLGSPLGDLRDPKLSLTPDGRLMLIGAAASGQPGEIRHQTLAWFSSDGRTWGEPVQIGDPNVWLWRLTWNKGRAYGIGYSTTGKQFLRLYTSRDGLRYETLADRLYDAGSPSETSILFLDDDTALCLLRRDAEGAHAMLGRARPPYRAWTWKDLGVKLGGPHMIRLPDGRIVAAGRLEEGRVRTGLCWLDPEAGTLKEFLALPSGGDSSYPGLAYYDGLLWVSYYSSHEGKTGIYLAKVAI